MTARAPSPAIFRAYDIRGVVGRDLDAPVARRIGQALGSEAHARGVRRMALGRDGRLSSPALAAALAEGLQATGIDLLDIGCAPTPLLYYAAHTRTGGSGVMVTGSHNPPDYNGLKMMLAGETLAGDAIAALHRRLLGGDLVSGAGRRVEARVDDDYLQRIVADVRLARPLAVVVDGGNGAGGPLLVRLLEALGCRVTPLYCDIDGRFPNHHPDPSEPKNLTDLIAAVQRTGADLGLALDGDGDRLGVVTPAGDIVWPDRLMVLFARDVLARQPGAEVVYDVKCSGHLARAVAAAGGRPVMWCTGHSLIKQRMRESGAALGGEMSGHLFFKERWYGFDDGLYAAARLLELLAADPRPPATVLGEIPDAPNTPELRVELAEGEPRAFMAKLAGRVDHFEGAQHTTIDGLRVDYADRWGLVRASNTTPSLVLRFEATDLDALRRIQAEFRDLMLELKPDLKLPF
jgi:phosphomannomutase/phosphoglucomutase